MEKVDVQRVLSIEKCDEANISTLYSLYRLHSIVSIHSILYVNH